MSTATPNLPSENGKDLPNTHHSDENGFHDLESQISKEPDTRTRHHAAYGGDLARGETSIEYRTKGMPPKPNMC